MPRVRRGDRKVAPGEVRGAASAAPRTTPLTIVSAAVAGDDLQSVAGSASDVLGRPVAIALPDLGAPVVWPRGACTPEAVDALVEHATAAIRGDSAKRPGAIADSVAIKIGHDVVGIVAALGEEPYHPDQRAWLEAAATAAAVTALMRVSQEGDLESSRRAFVRALAFGPPTNVSGLVGQARRLGFDLASGAIAICAQQPPDGRHELPVAPSTLLTDVGDGRVLGLVPLSSKPGADGGAEALAAELAARGMDVALSAPRPDPADLHEALREAELLVELAARPKVLLAGQEETFRLLIGVLLREPAELELLRAHTVSSLCSYDSEHDTELLATLRAFLEHHGSTTETAEAMRLHRHTVGYRLSRLQEVSGLSPYESDGRERLSLGLKADQILEADKRRSHHR
jgi:PucR C-terminal helix-turn-helix domain/GGDEF-like domain